MWEKRNYLSWPMDETDQPETSSAVFSWQHTGSNMVLDFHGNPQRAQLTLFSDGNHHMALAEAISAFIRTQPGLERVFYLTLPPSVLKQVIRAGEVKLGNLQITTAPHVIISPKAVLSKLHQQSICAEPVEFARHRGCALLIKKANPKQIYSAVDLARQDVTLFLSNPQTESVSHDYYRDYLLQMLAHDQQSLRALHVKLKDQTGLVYGEKIHHREAPEFLASGSCDVAILYHHLALYYERIFPDHFEMINLAEASPELLHSADPYAMALINQGGIWGEACMKFYSSGVVQDIYQQHGLESIPS